MTTERIHDSDYERVARWRQRVLATIHSARFAQPEQAPNLPPKIALAQHGWHSLRDGQTAVADAHFRAALRNDPYAVGAWLGLSRVVTDRTQRRACLQAALDMYFLLYETPSPPAARICER